MKDFFKNHWKELVIAVLSIVCIALIMSTTCTSQKLGKAETNIKALTDTLHTYELKNGELMYEKQGYILKVDELEQYLDISKKEAKEIEKKLNSALATISKLKAQVRVDTVHTIDSVYITSDSIYHNDFRYEDQWLSFNGQSTFKLDPFQAHTVINNISMDASLKVGMTEDDKWFATSDNPYLSFSSIEGANINKAKPKRFSIGVQLGVGLLGGYGISGAKDGVVRSGWIVGVGAYGGIGFTYKFIEF